MTVIDDFSSDSLIPFIQDNVEAGSLIKTDGWKAYKPLVNENYQHLPIVARKEPDKESVLSGVHLVASLVKRLIRGTHQGRFDPEYLQQYLDEYVFRFNRRNSRLIGKKFMRIVQQVVVSKKITIRKIHCQTARLKLGRRSLGLCG